jgi:hypothetical protein
MGQRRVTPSAHPDGNRPVDHPFQRKETFAMTSFSSLSRRTLVAAAVAIAVLPISAHAEKMGSTCSDCASYSGAYSIENTTGVTIRYQYRWGSSGAWKSMTLASGMVETHSYPIGGNKKNTAPTPYVRFDRLGGDKVVTWKDYRMEFYAVGYAGYTPASKANKTQPKKYVFRYAANGRDLDLKAKL